MDGENKTLEVTTVAYLFATHGYKQAEIAGMLGVSPATVVRDLQRARKDGWLEVRPRLRRALSSSELAAVKARLMPIRLKQRLDRFTARVGVQPLAGIHVVPSVNGDWDHRQREFGRLAAGYVLDLITDCGSIGVAWGSTPAAVVHGLEQLGAELPRRKKATTFLPLCGEPLGSALTGTSASLLAERLSRLVPGSQGHAYSLENVPALVPADFDATEIAVVHKLLGRVPAYQEIFGARGGALLEGLDAILTSTSAEGEPWGSRHDALVASAGMQRSELRASCIGDIGGVLLPRPQQAAREAVGRLMKNWTGLQAHQLARCAQRGKVVVAAIDKSKAGVVLEVVRQGLCSHLVIDSSLLMGLGKRLPD